MDERLSDAGYKVTEPRRKILEALQEAHGPLTAQEVAVVAGTSVASTYRALGLLVELGVVSETPDPADESGASEDESADPRGRRYALCSAAGHHHHFYCRACHATLDVACEALERALAELAAESGLAVERHDVMLRGVCGACQRRQEPVEVTA